MSKLTSLKKRKDFVTISQKGKNIMTAGLVLQVSENNSDEIRIGLTASKKVGNAVTRNLIKRRFRAISRDVTNKFKSGHDYVILARKSSSTREFDKLKKDLLYALYQ